MKVEETNLHEAGGVNHEVDFRDLASERFEIFYVEPVNAEQVQRR